MQPATGRQRLRDVHEGALLLDVRCVPGRPSLRVLGELPRGREHRHGLRPDVWRARRNDAESPAVHRGLLLWQLSLTSSLRVAGRASRAVRQRELVPP